MTDTETYQRNVRRLRRELHAVESGKPRRISLTEIIELLLSRGGSEHDRVALSRNSKGETQIEVEIRTRSDETVLDAEQRAVEVYERLRAQFPMSTGYVGANSDA